MVLTFQKQEFRSLPELVEVLPEMKSVARFIPSKMYLSKYESFTILIRFHYTINTRFGRAVHAHKLVFFPSLSSAPLAIRYDHSSPIFL